MAGGDLIFADGFDSGSLTGWVDALDVWIAAGSSRISGSGSGLYISRTSTYFTAKAAIYTDIFDYTSEFLFGFAFKFGTVLDEIALIHFMDGATRNDWDTAQLSLYINNTGKLAFGRFHGDFTITVLATGTRTVSAGAWHYVEGKVKIHASTGYVEIKLDGMEEISMTTSLDTTNTAANGASVIALGMSDSTGGTTVSIDDFYLFDNAGNGMSYMGDIRVLDLVPTSDGASSDFTPSTGVDNYATVDELPPVDSDYVYSNVIGHKDTYGLQNLPANAAAVFAVMYVTRSFKTDAGARTLRNVMRQSGVDYERADSDTAITLNASTTFYSETANPATTVAYTVSDINDNEFGFKLQA
jgi:hypothetical protein